MYMKGPHKNWNVHVLVIIKVTIPPENVEDQEGNILQAPGTGS